MKKTMKILGIMLLMVMLITGCGGNDVSTEPTDGTAEEQTTKFEGVYMVTADYVKENIGNENVVILDCRGAKKTAKKTIEGLSAHGQNGDHIKDGH